MQRRPLPGTACSPGPAPGAASRAWSRAGCGRACSYWDKARHDASPRATRNERGAHDRRRRDGRREIGAARPWTAHYPPDALTELAATPYRLLGEHRPRPGAADALAHRGDLRDAGERGMAGSLSFAAVDRLSDAFAAYLREDLKLPAGERVAIQIPNGLAYPGRRLRRVQGRLHPWSTSTPLHQRRDGQDLRRCRAGGAGGSSTCSPTRWRRRWPRASGAGRGAAASGGADLGGRVVPGLAADRDRAGADLCAPADPAGPLRPCPPRRRARGGPAPQLRRDRSAAYAEGSSFNAVACLQYTGGTTGVSKGPC